MNKIFKAICKSFKGKHPEGTVIHEVYVKGEFIKDAIKAAAAEITFWDPEHFDKYQAPKVSVIENGQDALEAYLLKKEQHGQAEITDDETTQQQTTNLFDEPSATVAEFAIAYPYAVRVAVALAKNEFLSSYSIINTEDNAVAVGFINSFNPKSFKEIDNAIVFAIGLAVDALNNTMSDILGSELESSVQMLKNYASDAESEFIDNYVEDIDLQSAKIAEAVVGTKKSTPSNKADDISIIADAVICHRDYKNCADPHEPEEFIGQVKANFKEILDEYGQLPGKQIAEHIKSLSEVRDLYNLGPCEEIAGFYITPQGNELSKAAQDALDKTIVASQEDADKDWPKGEPVGYDSSNEWQRLAFSILSKTNEESEPTPQQYKEIAAKLCGVFAEKGLDLMSGEFYSEVATQLITHAINADSVIATLFNLRELRGLISDIAENSTKEKNGLKPNHNTENEHECFIAEVLSRLQKDGANYLTGDQYEEAGEKLSIVLDEASQVHYEDGKAINCAGTLENIRNLYWNDISEASKVFLNVRSLRACIRENAELIKSDVSTSSDEIEIKSTHNKETGEDIMKIGENNFPYDSYEFHLDHLLRMNGAASLMGVGVFRRYAKALEKAYEHVDEKFKTGSEMASSVIKCFSVLGGNPEDKGIILDLLSDQEKLNERFELIKKTKGYIDPMAHLKAQLKEEQQVASDKPKQAKNKPETTQTEQNGLVSNGNATANNNNGNNLSSTGEAVKNAPNEKSGAPSVDSNPECDSGNNAGAPVLDSDESNGASVDIDNKVSELESQWSQDDQTKDNMRIWSQVHRTDRGITKQDHKGRKSIPIQYRVMKMTEVFGVYGFGWGYKILREWETEGAPIIINGENTGDREIIHHCEVELWVKIDGEKSEPATHYGDTKQYYYSNGYNGKPGYFVNDDEVHKKSLSDALGKAMTMFGVCADVYLGEHDDAHIDTLNHNMAEAAKKVRHLEEEEKIRTEVNEQVVEIIEEMQETTTKSGVNTLRAKALHAISGLPDISDEQKRKKSSVIQKLEVRYNERLQEIVAEQERKKQEKAEKAKQPDKEAAEPEKQEA